MPALVIGNVTAVRDERAMAEYREKVLATLQLYGGGFEVRGGTVDVLEGEWRPEHLSVMWFPTADHARRWYHSPEYAAILELRMGVDMELVLVAGEGQGLEGTS